MKIGQGDALTGDALTLFLILLFAGFVAVAWAYGFMKRRQERNVLERVRLIHGEFMECIDANKRLAEKAGDTISSMIDFLAAILEFLVTEKDSPEEVASFISLDLAFEGLTPKTLEELTLRLPAEAKTAIEKMLGQTWDQIIEDAITKPSSKGHETVGGNGDYF